MDTTTLAEPEAGSTEDGGTEEGSTQRVRDAATGNVVHPRAGGAV